jgi:hypothetical protein
MSYNYRYPGARPFESKQSDRFFGREKEIEEIIQLISIESFVVLYSKSGMGKSSLVNAGVIPFFKGKNTFEVINIRFGAYLKDSDIRLVDRVISNMTDVPNFLTSLRPTEDKSLWYYIKNRQIETSPNTGFILIFDQFEELFSYPDNEIEEFLSHLSELFFAIIPISYRKELEVKLSMDSNSLNTNELELLHAPLIMKSLIIIRSDRLSLLNRLKSYLPIILDVCYELRSMSFAQAHVSRKNTRSFENCLTSPYDS